MHVGRCGRNCEAQALSSIWDRILFLPLDRQEKLSRSAVDSRSQMAQESDTEAALADASVNKANSSFQG
jgi:hypothetical protein